MFTGNLTAIRPRVLITGLRTCFGCYSTEVSYPGHVSNKLEAHEVTLSGDIISVDFTTNR